MVAAVSGLTTTADCKTKWGAWLMLQEATTMSGLEHCQQTPVQPQERLLVYVPWRWSGGVMELSNCGKEELR